MKQTKDPELTRLVAIEMRVLLSLIISLCISPANADQFKIPYHGDFANSPTAMWSPENKDDSGVSNNFLNGAPEEGGKVQKDGELWVETIVPDGTTGPIPFVVLMHGCMGMTNLTSDWAHKLAKTLNADGIGVMVVDSYTTRKVEKSCGPPDLHWGRRRVNDAYSALDYLVEKKLASEAYIMGQSNGGLTTMVAISKQEDQRKNKFVAGFSVVPQCSYPSVRGSDFYAPLILFTGEKDDANSPKNCVELSKKKRKTPVQVVIYKDADHGFMEDYKARTMYGYTDSHGKVHNWTLSYNRRADTNMMQSIVSAIKNKTFMRGDELR